MSRKQLTRKFIENVNAVLVLQRGKVVETLEIKVTCRTLEIKIGKQNAV